MCLRTASIWKRGICSPKIIALPPIQTLSPMVMPRAYSGPLRPSLTEGSSGWAGGYSCTIGPIKTCTGRQSTPIGPFLAQCGLMTLNDIHSTPELSRCCSAEVDKGRGTHIFANFDGSAVQEAAVEVHVASRAHGNVVALSDHHHLFCPAAFTCA